MAHLPFSNLLFSIGYFGVSPPDKNNVFKKTTWANNFIASSEALKYKFASLLQINPLTQMDKSELLNLFLNLINEVNKIKEPSITDKVKSDYIKYMRNYINNTFPGIIIDKLKNGNVNDSDNVNDSGNDNVFMNAGGKRKHRTRKSRRKASRKNRSRK